MQRPSPVAVRKAAARAHGTSHPMLGTSSRAGAAALSSSRTSLSSFALELEATVSEALARASIGPSALTVDMEPEALARSDPARASSALHTIVDALRGATEAVPALHKAVNALSNLALSADRIETASSAEGSVVARRTPFFSLVMEAERSAEASRSRLEALAQELRAAVGARLHAEQRAEQALARVDTLQSQLKVLGLSAEEDAANAIEAELARKVDDEQKTRENVRLRSELGLVQRAFAKLHFETSQLRLVRGSSVVSRARFASLEARRRRSDKAVREGVMRQASAPSTGPVSFLGDNETTTRAAMPLSYRPSSPSSLVAPSELIVLQQAGSVEEAWRVVDPSERGSAITRRIVHHANEEDDEGSRELPAWSDRWWAGGEFSASWRGGDASASLLIELYTAFRTRLVEFISPSRIDEEATSFLRREGDEETTIESTGTGSDIAQRASARMLGPGPAGGTRSVSLTEEEGRTRADGFQRFASQVAAGAIPPRPPVRLLSLCLHKTSVSERLDLALELWEIVQEIQALETHIRAAVSNEQKRLARVALKQYRRRYGNDPPPLPVAGEEDDEHLHSPHQGEGGEEAWSVEDVLRQLESELHSRARRASAPLVAEKKAQPDRPNSFHQDEGFGDDDQEVEEEHAALPPLGVTITPAVKQLLQLDLSSFEPFELITGKKRATPPPWLQPVLRRYGFPLGVPPGVEISAGTALRLVYSAMLDKLRQETIEGEAAARVGRPLGANALAYSEAMAITLASAQGQKGVDITGLIEGGETSLGGGGRRAAVAVPAIEWVVLYFGRTLGSAEAAVATLVAIVDALEASKDLNDHACLVLDVLQGTRGESLLRYVLRSQLALICQGVNLDIEPALQTTGVESDSLPAHTRRSDWSLAPQSRPMDPGTIASSLYPAPHTPPIRHWTASFATYIRDLAHRRATAHSKEEEEEGDVDDEPPLAEPVPSSSLGKLPSSTEDEEQVSNTLASASHDDLASFLAWQVRRGGGSEPRVARFLRQAIQLAPAGAMETGIRFADAIRLASAMIRRPGVGVAVTPLLRSELVPVAVTRWNNRLETASDRPPPPPPRVNTGEGPPRIDAEGAALVSPPGSLRAAARAEKPPALTVSALEVTPLPLTTFAVIISYIDVAIEAGDRIVGEGGVLM
jgi:hypothetical protein